MATLTNTIEFPEELIKQIADKVSWTVMNAIRSQAPTQSNDIMGVPELCKYLDMSKRWVYDRVNDKSIPHMKIGGVLKFEKKDIDKWLETFRVPVVSNPPKSFLESGKVRNLK